MSLIRRLLPASCAALVALSLSGCATNEDPAQGGFFSGMKNLSDGTYDRRVEERRQTLQNEQDLNARQSRTASDVMSERSAVSGQLEDARARSAAMDADLAALRKRLEKAKSGNSKARQDAASLDRQVNNLQNQVRMVQQDSFTPEPEKKERLARLQKEKEDLERQVDTVLGR